MLRLPPDFDLDDEVPLLPLLFFVEDLPPDDLLADVLLPPDLAEDLDREDEEPPELRFDEDEEEPLLLFDREFPLDLDVAVLLPPDELELERPRPPPVFLPLDLVPPDEELDEPLLLPPLDFDPEPPLFDEDDDLRLEVDLDPVERPPLDAAARLEGTIVSAAAPTAPTAAPLAAPAKISLATSITLSTNVEVVERDERDELFRAPLDPFFEDEEDVFAISFLP